MSTKKFRKKRQSQFMNKKIDSRIHKLIHQEKKFQENAIEEDPLDTGFISSLCNISQGDGVVNREGNQVKWVSLHLRATIAKRDTGANNIQWRYMILLDKQPNKALPTLGQVLQNASPLSPLDRADVSRFKVLFSKFGILNDNAPVRVFKKFMKLNVITRYSGNTGTVTDLQTNNIIFLLISNAVAIGDSPEVCTYIRMRFTDS